MAIVFWDSQGLVHLDWFESSPNQSGLDRVGYCAILDRFYEAVRAKRPEKVRRGLLLLQDNAPCHRASVTTAKFQEYNIKTIPHPAYSPDMSPCDYYFSRVLKNSIRGCNCSNKTELEARVKGFFESKSESFYKAGIDKLPEIWNKVIEAWGCYFKE